LIDVDVGWVRRIRGCFKNKIPGGLNRYYTGKVHLRGLIDFKPRKVGFGCVAKPVRWAGSRLEATGVRFKPPD
jgi:hypothetical protein